MKAITAKHCIYPDGITQLDLSKIEYRHISEPNKSIRITEVIHIIKIEQSYLDAQSDFGDLVLLKLSDTVNFAVMKDHFGENLSYGDWITILGVNLVPFTLYADNDINKWIDALRFSRDWSSRRFKIDELLIPPQSATAAAVCIYHKAPTFPGMSGAPILGINRSKKLGDDTIVYVAGVHLRGGDAFGQQGSLNSCGHYPDFNIGITLPKEILEMLEITPQ